MRLGGEVWAGAKVAVDPVPLSADNRTISARVFSPAAGVRMVLKLEAADPAVNTGDLEAREPQLPPHLAAARAAGKTTA